jgi:hypothetical protein
VYIRTTAVRSWMGGLSRVIPPPSWLSQFLAPSGSRVPRLDVLNQPLAMHCLQRGKPPVPLTLLRSGICCPVGQSL